MIWRKSNFVLMLILVITIVTRFFQLSESATFFWDQAYDLNRIHEYYQHHKITLVGPISEDGSKVYSSLEYYLLMPFAVMFGFNTISTTIGTAVIGTITVILLWLIIKRRNENITLLMVTGGLLAIWFPLVETSRWAWNPNLIMFWIVLGLYCDQYKGTRWKIGAGLFFGLSIHQHYLAIIAVTTFLLAKTIIDGLKKSIGLWVGMLISILPFVLFDITHPPGLFLSRILYFNQTDGGEGFSKLIIRITDNLVSTGLYYTHSNLLTGLLILLIVVGIWVDGRNKPKNLIYIIPWIVQIIGVAFFNASYSHYFLGGLVFFIYWLAIERKGNINFIILVVLLAGSLMTIYPQVASNPWNKKEWRPNITTIDKIQMWIEDEYQKEKLNKVNIAVLGSSDSNTYGWKYRSLLAIRNINFDPKDNYHDSNYLFIVSETDELGLRSDQAIEMDNFRRGRLISTRKIEGSDWSVYLFQKQ